MPNIIGTAPNQVPTNADLGTMAYQDSNAVKVKDITFNDGSSQQTAANGFGFKNRIINGAMMIDQRNAGAAVTNSTSIIYTLDRWIVQTVGSSCVIQRVIGSTGNNKALRITGASGNTNTILSQKIEAANIYDCAGQAVTVSLTLSGSASGSVSVRFLYPTATDNFSSTTEPVAGTTVNFTTTATTYTVTRTLDANANKGLWVVIERGATGAGVTWSTENAQLEKGSTATSFDLRPYGTELALCQRYFYWNGGTNDTSFFNVNISNAAGAARYPAQMRAVPTVVIYNSTTAGQVSLIGGGTGTGVSATIVSSGSLAGISGSTLTGLAGCQFNYSVSAEL